MTKEATELDAADEHFASWSDRHFVRELKSIVALLDVDSAAAAPTYFAIQQGRWVALKE